MVVLDILNARFVGSKEPPVADTVKLPLIVTSDSRYTLVDCMVVFHSKLPKPGVNGGVSGS